MDLFRDARDLVPRLLREALGVTLPSYSRVESVHADLTQSATELRADVVLLFHDGPRVVHVLIVEVQLDRDRDKPYTWPAYVALERSRRRCPVSLIVVTLDEGTSAWARRPLGDGNLGGVQLAPIVLGPGQIPAEPAPEPQPELSLLSLLAHAGDEHVAALAEAALRSLDQLALDRARVYYQLITAVVSKAVSKGLLERRVMDHMLDRYREHFKSLYEEGVQAGEAKGRLEGKAEAHFRPVHRVETGYARRRAGSRARQRRCS